MNATVVKFGYPTSLVRDYAHWVVLLRPQQVTLGSLILACKEPARALAEVTPAGFTELAQVTREMEAALTNAFAYDKINYLLLMMVDPDVHFHVIPRYAAERTCAGVGFTDPSWPKPPDLTHEHAVPPDTMAAVHQRIRDSWPQTENPQR